MSQNYKLKLLWIINVIIPSFIEVLITVIIDILYLIAIILPLWIAFQLPLPSFISWIPLQLGQKFGSLLLLVSIYFSLAWLDAIYKSYKYGAAIPKSLMLWHREFPSYVKSVPKTLGWKRTAILLFILASLIIISWKILYQPQVNFERLVLIKNSLNNYQEQLLLVQKSNDKFKQEVKNVTNIDPLKIDVNKTINYIDSTLKNLDKSSDRTSIETQISTTLSQLSKSKSLVIHKINELGSFKNILNNNDGKLKGLFEGNKELKLEIESICFNKKSEANLECLAIKKMIEQNQISIDQFLANTRNLKSNEILELDKINANLIELRKSLAVTEEKIERAKGKYLFDIDTLNEWLTDTDEKLKNINNKISRFFTNNYAIQIDRMLERYHSSVIEVSKIEMSIQKLETETKLFNILNEANYNQSKLNIIDKDIQQIIPDLDTLDQKIQSEIDDLKSIRIEAQSFAHQAYLFLNQLSETSYKSQYEKQVSIIKKNSKDLLGKINSLIRNREENLNKIILQKDNLSRDIGQLTFSLKQLQYKNKIILNKAIRTRITTIATIVIIIIVLLIIIWIIVSHRLEQYQLNEKFKIDKQSSEKLKGLIAYFTDLKKTLKIRLYAVQKLNDLPILTEEEINQLKSLIRKLEKSSYNLEKFSYNNDIEVASRLKKTVDSLEIRASEKRRL